MKEKKITMEDIQKMEGPERMKYEIAEEMGLLDKVLNDGWRSLSAKETGKIGGIMTSRKKAGIKS
ncbi:MAG: small, acid-soluble spore protein, alpha/beta type [Lachnospiraceae bacterium]|nr:small, acid-soluble spore protein, alpha/beta type [Lachnospiraceae bacterium]MEE1014821.1 small, acid-soluble spore protein, alpha/beta type [Lachnospiraceae bacterium]